MKTEYNKEDLERWYSYSLQKAKEGEESDEAYCQAIRECNEIFNLKLNLGDDK